ncbi:MAG: sigma-70 family RNA polymerase sigma factor [Planctomycetes bacterium]|nr:sigma-70 family RNA polymerase sigma factor [Planctomycetota bacterium]
MQATPQEDDLLPKIAGGQPQAVEACMARYAPLVWSLVRRLSRDVATAEDLVQEIFIEIWKHAGRYDPAKASEATFIALIARRRVIDRQRRTQREPVAELLEESTPEAVESPLAAVDLSDEAGRARRVLERLRPEQRKLILMSVVDGLTHQEIAFRSGLPLGTIKSHIRRGLERAADLLREREPGGAS